MKRRQPTLTTSRLADIWLEVQFARDELFEGNEYMKMPEVWSRLSDGNENWKLKISKAKEGDDWKRKASVIEFDGSVTLIADETLWDNAKRGRGFENFLIAHELGHLILNHHQKSATVKHFELTKTKAGMVRRAESIEEREADFAGIFFQCGPALLDLKLDALTLARRAFSDVVEITKVQRLVNLSVFRQELLRPRKRYERVVL